MRGLGKLKKERRCGMFASNGRPRWTASPPAAHVSAAAFRKPAGESRPRPGLACRCRGRPRRMTRLNFRCSRVCTPRRFAIARGSVQGRGYDRTCAGSHPASNSRRRIERGVLFPFLNRLQIGNQGCDAALDLTFPPVAITPGHFTPDQHIPRPVSFDVRSPVDKAGDLIFRQWVSVPLRKKTQIRWRRR